MKNNNSVLSKSEKKIALIKSIERIKILKKRKAHEWIDTQNKFPPPFRLVNIETSTNKKLVGWWTKFQWDGFKLKKEHKITRWQKRRYVRVD